MKIDYLITGMDDIKKTAKALDSRKTRSLLSRALNQAAQPVVQDARRRADSEVGRDTGKGRRAIKKRTLKKWEREKLNLDQAVMVYLHSDGFYLGFWEREKGFTRNGKHYAAKPWLVPALDSNEAQVINRYRDRARVLIEREVAKGKK